MIKNYFTIIKSNTISPGMAGGIGAFLALVFLLTFIILGFIQPGYNHLINTISFLVVGTFGWVQTINFFFLAASFVFIGYGLGRHITQKDINSIFFIFVAFAVSTIVLAFIPTDNTTVGETIQFKSLSSIGLTHYFVVLGILLLIPIMLFQVLKGMWTHPHWKSYIPFTLSLLIFNFVTGLLWFYFVNLGYLNEWKGLIQKILAGNVVFWLVAVGNRLRILKIRHQH